MEHKDSNAGRKKNLQKPVRSSVREWLNSGDKSTVSYAWPSKIMDAYNEW